MGYFGKPLSAEAPRPSRHFPSLRRSGAVCTPAQDCQLLPGPGWIPVQPTVIVLLPALAATVPTGVRLLGTEERGRRGRWALQPPFSGSFAGISPSTWQPRVPVLSHRSALLHSLPRDAPTPLIPRVGGWVGSRQEMTTSKGPGKILGLSGKDLKTAWKGWGG